MKGTYITASVKEPADLCEVCNRRIKLFSLIKCKCKKTLCKQHFAVENHACEFDYRSHGRQELEQQNPVVEPRKVEKL